MTEQEYKDKTDLIDNEHLEKIKNLMKQYAHEQIKFKVGDIISHPIRGTIQIKSISAYKGLNPFPEPKYNGPLLTKELIPRKDKAIGSIFGQDSDIILIKSFEKPMTRTTHIKIIPKN
jgi:hypothetical protein